MEPRPAVAAREDPPLGTEPEGQGGPGQRHGLPARDAERADRAVRWDADRAVFAVLPPVAGVELSRAGVGPDAGTARVVSGDGRTGGDGTDPQPGRAGEAPRPVDEVAPVR